MYMYMNVHCTSFILPSDIHHPKGNGAGRLVMRIFTRHPLGCRSSKRVFAKALIHDHVDVNADEFHC